MGCGVTFDIAVGKALHSLSIQERLTLRPPQHRQKQTIIVIAGPTGCGKSDIGMALAKEVFGEILSADSMQVYRGMDIGTAKASREERLLVPHHLIDIRDVTDPMNVLDYYHEASFCLTQIRDRQTIAIIVGGSGFYIHALLHGPPQGPPSDAQVRASLEKKLLEQGVDQLYRMLQQLDSEYAKTITRGDRHKIVRALEIIEISGQKVSSLEWRKKPLNPKYDFHCFCLNRSRDKLYERINKRCDNMLEKGFLDEVMQLEKQGLCQNPAASHAVGYRQALDFLATERSDDDLQRFTEAFKQATRAYAKRQLTWFRREPLFEWLDLDLMNDDEVVRHILRSLDVG